MVIESKWDWRSFRKKGYGHLGCTSVNSERQSLYIGSDYFTKWHRLSSPQSRGCSSDSSTNQRSLRSFWNSVRPSFRSRSKLWFSTYQRNVLFYGLRERERQLIIRSPMAWQNDWVELLDLLSLNVTVVEETWDIKLALVLMPYRSSVQPSSGGSRINKGLGRGFFW